MPYGTVNADVITTSTAGGVLGAGNASIMKNRLINGSMVIDQRNAGASVTQTTSVLFSADRWFCYGTQASKFTIQQNAGSVTPPVGFTNYIGVTSSAATTVGTGDIFDMGQRIEGFNVADLGWGTANAKTVTVSFWVRSSLTGTFGGAISNGDYSYSYPFSYAISSANTWEQKSVTIAGATSGTWLTTNGIGAVLLFGLGVGSTNSGTAGSWSANGYASATGATSVVGTSGATFYITGVQLEVGSSATGFEYVNYQTSLANCQRYFRLMGSASRPFYVGGYTNNSNDTEFPYSFGVDLRATPTVTITTLSNTNGVPYSDTASTDKTSIGLTRTTTGTQNASFYATVSAEL